MSEASTAVVVTPSERAALTLNSTKTEKDLTALVALSADITAVLDMDGREQAHRIAMNLRTARTTIEKTGKAARDDATKFSKAVIAEEDRLKAIIAPEEKRVLGLRDAWDAEQERIQAEKVATERLRTDAHEANINAIMMLPANCAGFTSQRIMQVIESAEFKWEANAATWEEFEENYASAYGVTIAKLREMHGAALALEEAARAEAEAREVERQRIATEQAELARQRAEQEEQARALAAQQKALDDARIEQEAALQRQRDEEAAKARAADMERQKQADKLAADRAAFEAEQRAVKKKAESELKAAQDVKDASDNLAREQAESLEVNVVGIETAPAAEALNVDTKQSDVEPDDEEIIALYVANFGGTPEQAIDRLARFAAQYEKVMA